MTIIATSGIRKSLPLEFPLSYAENSGNIVHGNAPAQLFPNTMASLENNWRVQSGKSRFREFVSEDCSHVIITMANLFRVGDHSPKMRERYIHFKRSISGYDKPLIIFGMGAQKKGDHAFEPSMLPEEGIDALKAIGERATAVSVRGEFTKRMLESVIGPADDRVFVTGCPSYYTRPEVFSEIKSRISDRPREMSIAVNVTDYRRSGDQSLVAQSFERNGYLVEPSNRAVHQYAVAAAKNRKSVEVPSELSFLDKRSDSCTGFAGVDDWFASKYRLFRHFDSWIDFNREFVDFTVGTRFHANMASMLAGVPAVWVTHDVRTEELTRALHLPSVDINRLKNATLEEIYDSADFDGFLGAAKANFEHFNEFLRAAELPTQALPTI